MHRRRRPAAATTIPCWRFPQDISTVQINNAQTTISARVYYFVVTDTDGVSAAAPRAPGSTGLFNAAGAFTYTGRASTLTTPTVRK